MQSRLNGKKVCIWMRRKTAIWDLNRRPIQEKETGKSDRTQTETRDRDRGPRQRTETGNLDRSLKQVTERWDRERKSRQVPATGGRDWRRIFFSYNCAWFRYKATTFGRLLLSQSRLLKCHLYSIFHLFTLLSLVRNSKYWLFVLWQY